MEKFADTTFNTAIAFLIWGLMDRLLSRNTDLVDAGLFLLCLSAVAFVVHKAWRSI